MPCIEFTRTAELDCNLYTHGCSSNRQPVSYYLRNGTNTVNPVPISPLLSIIFSAINNAHGDVAFVNDNSLSASFVTGLNRQFPSNIGFIQLASASHISSPHISPVPLPAALPLFGTALAGLVFRSNQMIHSLRLRSRQGAVPSGSTVNHVFDPEH